MRIGSEIRAEVSRQPELKGLAVTVQHVLVPIDFSPYAEQAFDYAIALAQKLRARVTLLHVIQPPLVTGADMGVWPSPTFIDELEAAITRDLEGYLARVTAAGLEGEMAVVHGTPFHEILETARKRQVDLIIMGTHGRTGLPHVLLGSVAEKVARLASCPVLIARQPAPGVVSQGE
jgi:nucleotide-binding universal stress UspA family protein